MRLSLSVPLAALATVLTLLSSSFLLRFSGSQHFRIIMGTDGQSQPTPQPFNSSHANEYRPEQAMLSAASLAAALPAPTEAVLGSAASKLPKFSAADFEGKFLFAHEEPAAALQRLGAHRDPTYMRRLLKSLLGMSVMLQRTLVLPAALCRCRGTNLTDCDGPPVSPFDCPIKEALPAKLWQQTNLVKLRPARFLLGDLPEKVRRSHVRLLLPDGKLCRFVLQPLSKAFPLLMCQCGPY